MNKQQADQHSLSVLKELVLEKVLLESSLDSVRVAAVQGETKSLSEDHNKAWEKILSRLGLDKELLFPPEDENLQYITDTLFALDVHSVEDELISAAVMDMCLKLEADSSCTQAEVSEIDNLRRQRVALEQYQELLGAMVLKIRDQNVEGIQEAAEMLGYQEEILNLKKQELLSNMEAFKSTLESSGLKKELEHESLLALHNKLVIEEQELDKLGKEFGGVQFIPSSKVEARKIFLDKKKELADLDFEFEEKIQSDLLM